MTNVTSQRLLLDSNIWLGYFLGNMAAAKEFIDSDENLIFTSVISIHEVFKRMKKLGYSEDRIAEAIGFIEDNSAIVNLSASVAISAARNCEEYSLHTIDSLIYSGAMELETVFVTADKDFSKTPFTEIVRT